MLGAQQLDAIACVLNITYKRVVFPANMTYVNTTTFHGRYSTIKPNNLVGIVKIAKFEGRQDSTPLVVTPMLQTRLADAIPMELEPVPDDPEHDYFKGAGYVLVISLDQRESRLNEACEALWFIVFDQVDNLRLFETKTFICFEGITKSEDWEDMQKKFVLCIPEHMRDITKVLRRGMCVTGGDPAVPIPLLPWETSPIPTLLPTKVRIISCLSSENNVTLQEDDVERVGAVPVEEGVGVERGDIAEGLRGGIVLVVTFEMK
eukprot:PhF_6_TR15478/c0_g1_i2/m.24072